MKYRCEFLIILTFLILITNGIVQAQVDTLWTKTFGGFDTDNGCYAQQTTDGGYIIVGCTESFGVGNGDIWLIKTSTSGDTLWTKTYGGNNADVGYSVQQTTDGGYIIVGYTNSFGAGWSDIWLIKTNAFGDTLWTKTFGGIDSDAGYSVQQTTDGGYIIVGYTYSFGAGNGDLWLIKTNTLGDTLWTKTIGGNGVEDGKSVQQTTDGGYIIIGYTDSFGVGNGDIWLIKTNALGDTLWTRTFGEGSADWGNSVQQTTDGGYIIVGNLFSYVTWKSDIWLVKTNASGDVLWTKKFGGEDSDTANSVQQTTDGGYVILGDTDSFGAGANNIWLIKTNASGDTLWSKTFGGEYIEVGHLVQQTTDGGYIIVGFTSSFGAGDWDVWLIKTTPDPSIIKQNDDIIISEYKLHQNYPNPFNPVTRITYTLPHSNDVTLTIFDLLGRKVETLVNEFQTAGHYSQYFDASNLSSGSYFYQLKVRNNSVATKKMILTR